jgi:flagellin-like protein
MNTANFGKPKGISPIIATLLLILIAIAASVILYAYVIGFVGQTSQNNGTGSTPLQFSQASASSVTQDTNAYLTNAGSTSAQLTLNSAYISSATLTTTPLAPELVVTLECTTCAAQTVAIKEVNVTYASASTALVAITVSARSTGCNSDFCYISAVSFMGISGTGATVSCGSASTQVYIGFTSPCQFTMTIPYQGVSFTSAFLTNTGILTTPITVTLAGSGSAQTVTQQVGSPITAGAIVLASGAQIQLVECGAATTGGVGNSLTVGSQIVSGTVYSLKAVATDGSSSLVSVKAK